VIEPPVSISLGWTFFISYLWPCHWRGGGTRFARVSIWSIFAGAGYAIPDSCVGVALLVIFGG
jgi:ABC-type microcin C transport system permease subunit YejB